MSSHIGKVATVATVLAIGNSTAFAQDENRWNFELTPYLWGAGIDTDVTIQGRTANVDKSASDVFDALDFGGSILGVGQINRFVVWTQLDYLATDTDELDDAPTGGRLETDLFVGTLAFGYQFGDMRGSRALDVLLGARYLQLENELTIPAGRFNRDTDYTDPVIILRPSFRLSERWRLNPTFSYGTGGDSESTYELQPQIQFQINDHLAARFGYRKLYYDIESDNGLNKWDGSFQGLLLGLGGTFGSRPVTMAAAPPPPPPAPQPMAAVSPPPAPPGDADGDGILDNIDKCGNTAAGEQVDPIGCAFNVKIGVQFATNSAELTPESHQELDELVEVLNSTSTLSGYVEGYTDSTGSAEYNKELSEKRALAVADYLISHGVSRDRVIAKGHGESNPVADNSTPDGRAENRRVILRRVDADR